ncbi:MAG: flagellar biosynthesis anti-sigma factor FlgM [Proteobacteria bacterium]|nr:flagellar biosynthesis anti-sigma factor FlgM [Pseudomonadota bacterium]
MRINQGISQAPSQANSSSVQKTEKAKSNAYDSRSGSASATTMTDSASAEISTRARDMAKAKQAASEAPDVREARIAELREQILNKKYDVSADAIADRLVDDHLRLAGA